MPARLARKLHELIEAIDRRVPHEGRAGEALIASDAAQLRGDALKQLADLENATLSTSQSSSQTEERTPTE